MSFKEKIPFYQAMILFIASPYKNRLLTEVFVAAEIESGKFWPRSEQHLVERLREVMQEKSSLSDQEYAGDIKSLLSEFDDGKLASISQLRDLERCLDRIHWLDGNHVRNIEKGCRSYGEATPRVSLPCKITEEQELIVSEAARSENGLSIQGYAGCGKTTAVELVYYSDDSKKDSTLFTAFNKGIVKDIEYRNPGIEAKTFDSLGFRYGLDRSPWSKDHVGVDGLRVGDFRDVLGISPSQCLTGSESIKGNRIARLAFSVIEAFSNSSEEQICDSLIPSELIDPFARSELLSISQRAWDTIVATPDMFNQRIVRPSFVTKLWSMSGGRLPSRYSRLIVDEAQDVNGSFARIIENSKDIQIVYAGDEFQQLYLWRGAVNMICAEGVPKLDVTNSFRYGDAIASYANFVLNSTSSPPVTEIKSFHTNSESVIKEYSRGPSGCDVILSRNRATIFSIARDLAKNNDSYYLNLDLIDWKFLLDSALALFNGDGLSNAHRLVGMFDDWYQLEAYADSTADSDLLMCIKVVKSFHKTLTSDLEKIMELNQLNEKDAKIVLSTTHKIKGRSWNKVALANDFIAPITRDNITREEFDAEMRVVYVAATRAENELQIPEGLTQAIKMRSAELID